MPNLHSTRILGDLRVTGLTNLNQLGPVTLTGQLTSTVATSTAPFVIASTTAVTNLNADLLDGNHASAFYLATNPSGYTTNTGTVTSVATSGTVSGLTLTGGTITTSGTITLGGTLAVTASNFASQTQKTFLAAPNAADGVPTFRTILASDVPTLNQNTTGSSNLVSSRSTITYGLSGLQWTDVSGTGGTGLNGASPNNPTNEWWHHIILNHANNAGYYVDIAAAFHTDDMYFRRNTAGTLGTWREIIHSENIGSQSVSSAATLATTQKSDNVNYQIPFVTSVTAGNQSLFTDSAASITFNPSTDILNVPNLTVTGSITVNNVEMISTSNGIVFEGTSNDEFETTLRAINPTADRTIELPNAGGTVALTSDLHTRSHTMTSTSDHTAGNWSVFHSNGSGQVVELALAAAGQYLRAGGVAAAPTFAQIAYSEISGTPTIPTGFAISAGATDGLFDITGTGGTNSVSYSFAPYAAQQALLSFDTSASNPSRTDRLNLNGVLHATRFISTVATGTAPFEVTSTTKVSNLNADLLDGLDSTAFYLASNPSGYLTSYTEVDTLANVTSRGQTSGRSVTGELITFSNATNSTTTASGALVVTGGVGIGGTATATAFSGETTTLSSTSPTLTTTASGAKTANFVSNVINATATSSTNSVTKTGLSIQSTGTWNGSNALNRALLLNATGGAINKAIEVTAGSSWFQDIYGSTSFFIQQGTDIGYVSEVISGGEKTGSITTSIITSGATSSTSSVTKTGLHIDASGTWNGTSAVNRALLLNASGGTINRALEVTAGISILQAMTATTGAFSGALSTDTSLGLRAAATASTSTQIPVFIADPASTTRTLVTRTPAQLRSDIGAQVAGSYLTAHPTITVTADTTTAASPAFGGTFTAIDGVTRDGNGHVTTLNTKTVTIPTPSYPTVNNATLTLAASTGISLSATPTFTANASADKTITITNSAPHIGTNLTWTPGTTAGPVVNSSTGTGAAIPSASATASGAVTTAAQEFAGNKTFSGITSITNATASTTTSTGALIVTGGVGIGGNANIGGNLTVTGNITVNNVEMINTSNGVIFEGSTNDGFETTLTAIDPTADRTLSLPNASGTVATQEYVTGLGYTTNTGTVTSVAAGAGMDFTTFTTSGSVTMGTPSTLTSATSNSASGTTHTHAITTFDVTGTANQITVTGAAKVLGAATTLSLPQNIHTAATPQFARLGLGIASSASPLHIKNATPEVKLEAGSSTDSGTMRYNTTTKSIEFIFA